MRAYDHRARARAALTGNWIIAALVTLLASILTGGSGPSIEINIQNDRPVQITLPEEMSRFLLEVVGLALPMVLMIAMVLLLVRLVLGGVVELGLARYHLNLMDGVEAQLADLFTGFSRFLQALIMGLVRDLLTFFGFCLLIVPGAMLHYGFAMAPKIMAEDPDCTGWEALWRSYDLMRGHRLDLFFLELSFLGWGILAAFTFGIGNLFLEPYVESAKTSFYRELTATSHPGVEF